MGRTSFVFYESFYEAISELGLQQQAKIYNAICQYALFGTEPNLSGVLSSVFKLIRPQIDANNQRYENGKKGGRPLKSKVSEGVKTKTKPKKNQSKTNPEPNVNVNVNVNDNVNENGNGNVARAREAADAAPTSDGYFSDFA